MSPDWPWPVMLALAAPTAIGHLCHFIYVVNVTSGLGYREPAMDRFRRAVFAALLASSAFLLWKHMHEPWWLWSWPLGGYAILCLVSGALGWPIASLRRALRRRPGGIQCKSQTLDLARIHGAQSLIGTGRRSWLLRLPRHDSFRIERLEWDVSIADLPAPLDALRIVQLSDFHFAPCFRRQFFESVVEGCRGWAPDLVLVTGDLVEHDDTISWIEPVLGRLEARLGKFAILGNHDQDHDPRTIVHELERAGIRTLEGRWIIIDVDGSKLAVGGTSTPWGPAFHQRDVPPADFRILMSHSPDVLYKAATWGADLVFAGHNHGGQIRLPTVGPVFMPSRYSRRFDRGFFRHGGTLLYVSQGIAGKHPIRYGCPPEISRFVLHRSPVIPGPEGGKKAGRSRESMVRQ